jgi:hypothetical protein
MITDEMVNIFLLILNAAFCVLNYNLGNFKLSSFCAFTCGFLLYSTIINFL